MIESPWKNVAEPVGVGVEPATSWSPVGRPIQLSWIEELNSVFDIEYLLLCIYVVYRDKHLNYLIENSPTNRLGYKILVLKSKSKKSNINNREYKRLRRLDLFARFVAVFTMKDFFVTSCLLSCICLFVLRFYNPVNPVGSCRARIIYLTTL